MTDQLALAITTGVVMGTIMAIPLIGLCYAVRQLTKVVARSKLSLDDYLALELGEQP